MAAPRSDPNKQKVNLVLSLPEDSQEVSSELKNCYHNKRKKRFSVYTKRASGKNAVRTKNGRGPTIGPTIDTSACFRPTGNVSAYFAISRLTKNFFDLSKVISKFLAVVAVIETRG